MNGVIHKYEITDGTKVFMPSKIKMLDVQIQHGNLVVWVLKMQSPHPFDVQDRIVTFHVIGTGQTVRDIEFFKDNYIGTVQDGPLVWHVFYSG